MAIEVDGRGVAPLGIEGTGGGTVAVLMSVEEVVTVLARLRWWLAMFM